MNNSECFTPKICVIYCKKSDEVPNISNIGVGREGRDRFIFLGGDVC